MASNFDWAHPTFGISMPDPYTAVQQAKQQTSTYTKKAPKKTLKKKPRNNTQRYVWDNGMTFEEKADMLARGDLRNHVRNSMFIDDLDRYATPTEQIMDWLENASPNTQRYFGVYDDIMARRNAKPKSVPVDNTQYGPYELPGITKVGGSPRRSKATTRPTKKVSVPQPTIEPEPIVDRTPLDVTDTTARDWGLWNPTTAMASYQADSGLRRAAMQPVTPVPLTGVQLAQGGPIWLLDLC